MMKETVHHLLRTFRLPHWSKNVLLVVPLIAAHKGTEPTL